MKKFLMVLCFVLAVVFVSRGYVKAGQDEAGINPATESEEVEKIETVKDSIPAFNKAMFAFNDKAYYYFFKPIHRGYSFILPTPARKGVNNFFENLKMPVRFFNCLFQGNVKGAGTEISRFVINSTIGVGGLWDPSKSLFNINKQNRDFGQTLGKIGAKPGTYIVLPFLGPSNTRDMSGLVVDTALSPLSWVSFFFLTPPESVGNYSLQGVNDLSLDTGGTYESITKEAIDQYIALQDAYTKYREKKVRE